ncbi:MAG: succinyldiaminopimelate transaminase [Mycobacteriales bacterium]
MTAAPPRQRRSLELPEFPWDRLADVAGRARAHPDGLVDLSVGTPVDATPPVVRQALAGAADWSGYPPTAGDADLVAAARWWLHARLGAPADVAVLPVIGSKELVALLPWLLGSAGPVCVPELAYPTYEVGALLAGTTALRGPASPPPGAGLVWVNSPSNPTGQVASAAELRAALDAARAVGAVLASDECYVEYGWDALPVSVLHPDVTGGDLTGVLSVHSLSKRSNVAGYRIGLVAGDPELVTELLALRKHAGLMVPGPVQAAAAAAWRDTAHVSAQRERYAARRARLWPALERAGFRVEHSEAGLYLWCTRQEDCWTSVAALADLGILVAPGDFYGPAGARHVRVALTASDERIAAAALRLATVPG